MCSFYSKNAEHFYFKILHISLIRPDSVYSNNISHPTDPVGTGRAPDEWRGLFNPPSSTTAR